MFLGSSNIVLVWLNLCNADLSLKRYWRELRSQEVGDGGVEVGVGGVEEDYT